MVQNTSQASTIESAWRGTQNGGISSSFRSGWVRSARARFSKVRAMSRFGATAIGPVPNLRRGALSGACSSWSGFR